MSEKPVRGVIVADCLYAGASGGTERQILRYLQLQRAIGAATTVVFLRGDEAPVSAIEASSLVDLKIRSVVSVASVHKLLKLVQLLKSNNIQILSSYFDDASIVCAAISRFLPDTAFVCWQRNLAPDRGWFSDRLFKWVYKSARIVCANSHGVAKMLVDRYKVDSSRIRVIDNFPLVEQVEGDDQEHIYSQFVSKDNSQKLIVCVANLRPVKGVEDLIDCIGLLMSRSKHAFRVAIAGDGPEMPRLREKVRELELEETVLLLGYVKSTRRLVESADLCVLPSRAEGASNALASYMKEGKPIVATNVGGNADYLQYGTYGRLVEAGRPESLAEGIEWALDHLDVAQDQGVAAKEYALNRFSEDRIISEYRSLYSELISSVRASK